MSSTTLCFMYLIAATVVYWNFYLGGKTHPKKLGSRVIMASMAKESEKDDFLFFSFSILQVSTLVSTCFARRL